jgi:hypothetical protein
MERFRKKGQRWIFQKTSYVESDDPLPNPGRGYYSIHSFPVQEPVREEELRSGICKEHQLALVRLDIGAYRDRPIEEAALENIRRILAVFRREKQEVILRTVYDTAGRGMEKEPPFLAGVVEHIGQLGPVFRENRDVIYTLQGVFVGNWGEMHGSRFLKGETLRLLLETLLEATGGTCRLAVRRPVQWRLLFPETEFPKAQRDPETVGRPLTGLFNDGMLASESDLGTYGTGRRSAVGWEEPWQRREELDFVSRLCRYVPNGGEVVRGEYVSEPKAIVEALRALRVSYLNGVYDGKVLTRWKKIAADFPGACRGIRLFDYIGLHLGYRFVVKRVKLHASKGGRLKVEIANVGFSNLYEEAEAILLFQETRNGTWQRAVFCCDPRDWDRGAVSVISLELPPLIRGEYQLYLALERKKDRRVIRFANRQAREGVFLGLLRPHGAIEPGRLPLPSGRKGWS